MSILVKILLLLVVILIILLLAIIVLIKPNKRRDTSYFEKKLYAHRGLHGEGVPENSLTAFKLAREGGFGVELDVQMTKDKKLVVFHDGNLKRMCGKDAFLRDFTYEELLELRLLNTEEIIPLFEDVLKVLGPTDLICEIKADNGAKCYELCEKAYDMLTKYEGRFVIESFSPYIVKWFKDNHPEIIRGQLSCNFMQDKKNGFFTNFSMTHLLVNAVSKPDFVAYRHQDIKRMGFKLCKRLYHPFLVGWTARGDEEQEKAWGSFDSVIFEKIG